MRSDHLDQLHAINHEVILRYGAPLVAVPICRRATEPGDLSHFLLELGVDPFRRWNMLYYASDRASARELDTHVYDPAMEGLHDGSMADVIRKVRLSWMTYLEEEPDATPEQCERYRDMLRAFLVQCGVRFETMMFRGKRNLWQEIMAQHEARGAA